MDNELAFARFVQLGDRLFGPDTTPQLNSGRTFSLLWGRFLVMSALDPGYHVPDHDPFWLQEPGPQASMDELEDHSWLQLMRAARNRFETSASFGAEDG